MLQLKKITFSTLNNLKSIGGRGRWENGEVVGAPLLKFGIELIKFKFHKQLHFRTEIIYSNCFIDKGLT